MAVIEPIRLVALRVVLILLALGEGVLGGVSQVFYPQRSAEREGRDYNAGYHGVMQDFGFYNVAFALLYGVAAFDPRRNLAVIEVGIFLLVVHGATHVARYFGIYYGGGEPLPSRPARRELSQGLTLLAGAVGLILFFP